MDKNLAIISGPNLMLLRLSNNSENAAAKLTQTHKSLRQLANKVGDLRPRRCICSELLIMQQEKGLGVYNVVIIGAGTAGLVAAAGTAVLGGRVALIERNKMGGDCLNYGCCPSKALIASARAINNIRPASKWGLDEEEPRFEFQTVFESMRSRRAKIAPNDSIERFESLGVDVFLGEARFVSPHEIAVGAQILQARNFVIAAGTRARIPPIEGICDVPFFTNETIFDELHKKPERRLVLGAGQIGL